MHWRYCSLALSHQSVLEDLVHSNNIKYWLDHNHKSYIKVLNFILVCDLKMYSNRFHIYILWVSLEPSSAIILCMRSANEMALLCNAISHWLGAYTEWSLFPNLDGYSSRGSQLICNKMYMKNLCLFYISLAFILLPFYTWRPEQNGCHFANIFKCIFLILHILDVVFQFKFHWNLSQRVQLTIMQHWLR